MIIRLKKHSHNFVIIDSRPLRNAALSWRAKGLLAYLMTLPDNWVVVRGDLVERSSDGRSSVQAAFQELKVHGHATLELVRNAKGQVVGKEWHIHEKPMPVEDAQ
jgi:hypothetical protein